MKHQRLIRMARAASAAAALTLATMTPAAQAAPGPSEVDGGEQQALLVSDDRLRVSPVLEDHAAIGRLSDATVVAEALIEAGLDTPLGGAQTLGDASVGAADSAIDVQESDATVLRPLPTPSVNTRVPGLSEAELLRYKRQMLRKDI